MRVPLWAATFAALVAYDIGWNQGLAKATHSILKGFTEGVENAERSKR